jgi:hypothetical protein
MFKYVPVGPPQVEQKSACRAILQMGELTGELRAFQLMQSTWGRRFFDGAPEFCV